MLAHVTPKQRAEPLSRAERKKAILEAVIPLLVENGARVTTSEMARAAGIAEGTIFRVFPDKSALLHEAVASSFDPDPYLRQLDAISPDADLEDRVRRAAQILDERFDRIYALVSVVRSLKVGHGEKHGDAFQVAKEASQRITSTLTELFGEAETELSVPPRSAAVLLNTLIFAIHFPYNTEKDRLTTDEVVTILLNGILSKGTR
jgi:AcrR family transcriptional regulator